MDIAVIGLACRMPGGANSGDELWELLMDGKCTASEPGDRFNMDGFHHAQKGRLNTSYPRRAHFMTKDVAAFDAGFFGISASEARAMDPQQRMLLEVTHEAFEDAGLPMEVVAGSKTSCFVGVSNRDYRDMLYKDADGAPRYTLAGSSDEILANRVSWFFDLRGPSCVVETACSSSLVALHQACQSLRTGESTMAVVGGANLLLNPDMFQFLSNQGFLARDGLCKAFDSRGDGYGRGEGIVALILKPAAAAMRDGDEMRAVIRATGVNQDGKTAGGITVPSTEAQQALIAATYSAAGLAYDDTSYFEAHGTGTKAGDPRELGAVAATLTRDRSPELPPLWVGSIKTNVGHLEAASGLAGLVKSIYIVQKGIIPASLHFTTPNPNIPFDNWKIRVPTRNVMCPVAKSGARRVSLNSFGFGGTNAHVILDDAKSYIAASSKPVQPNGHGHVHVSTTDDLAPAPPTPKAFLISAADQKTLSAVRSSLHAWLDEKVPNDLTTTDDFYDALGRSEDSFLRQLAVTLSDKRSRLPWRTACLARSVSELKQKLATPNNFHSHRAKLRPLVGFIFTGQGAQWAGMGLPLMRYPVFRKSVEHADSYLRGTLGATWSAIDELARDPAESRLDDPELSQSLCTALQIALVDLLAAWNIKPAVVVGHSSGEIAAAYCLGALDKLDALRIAYFRGRLSSELQAAQKCSSKSHGMLAVAASRSDAENYICEAGCIAEQVVIACVNSPLSVTLSGTSAGIDRVAALLTAKDIFNRKLRVNVAYHSAQMNLIASAYEEAIREIHVVEPPAAQDVQMFSSVTGGRLADPAELGYHNWIKNLVSPVCFKQAMESLLTYEEPTTSSQGAGQTSGVDILLEIGPHCALQSPVQEILANLNMSHVQYDTVLRRAKDGLETAVDLAGRLAVMGLPVNMKQVHSDESAMQSTDMDIMTDLPKYPWNHSKTYWAETRLTRHHKTRQIAAHARLLGASFPATSGSDFVWRKFWRVAEEPWLNDYKIHGHTTFPAAGFVTLAVEGARQMVQQAAMSRCILRDVQIMSPALCPNGDGEIEIIVQIRHRRTTSATAAGNSAWFEFSISSGSTDNRDGGLCENCRGLVKPELELTPAAAAEIEIYNEQLRVQHLSAFSSCKNSEHVDEFYDMLSTRGLSLGPRFRNLQSLSSSSRLRCFEVEVPAVDEVGDDHVPLIHPTTLESILQSWNPSAAAEAANRDVVSGRTLTPTSFDEIVISADVPCTSGNRLKGWSTWTPCGLDKFRADITVMDIASPCMLLTMKGMKLTFLDKPTAATVNKPASDTVFSNKVQWIPFLPHIVLPSDHPGPKQGDDCKENHVVNSIAAIDSFVLDPLALDAVTIIEPLQQSDFASHLTGQLHASLRDKGIKTDSVDWQCLPPWQRGRMYVTMLDVDHAFFANMRENDWQKLKSLFTGASNILWLSRNSSPDLGTVLGLARVLRNELESLDLRTLQISQSPSSNRLVELVTKVSLHTTRDKEFRERDRSLEVSRIVPLEGLDSRILRGQDQCEDMVALDAFPMKLTVPQSESLETICFSPDDDFARELGPYEIEIDVQGYWVEVCVARSH